MEAATRHRILWGIGQVVVSFAFFLTFFAWAPWWGARATNEFPAEVVAKLPPGCPAVAVNHGSYTCIWTGTPSSNPWGFGALTLLWAAEGAFLLFSGLTGRGIKFK